MNLDLHLPLLLLHRFDEFLSATAGAPQAPAVAPWRLLAGNLRAAKMKKLLLWQALHPALEDYVQSADDQPPALPAAPPDAGAIVAAITDDRPVAVCGVAGRAALVAACAAAQPQADGRLTSVHFIEPSPRAVLDLFRRHNWAREGGPLQSAAVSFWVGESCFGTLEDAFRRVPTWVLPGVLAGDAALIRRLEAVLGAVRARRQDRALEALRHREAEREMVSDRAVARMLVNPPEAGAERRVVLVGNRFHARGPADYDAARLAFERMGWRTRGLIEGGPQHRVTPEAVASVLADLRPHLIVDLHQPLLEQPGVLPKGVPVVALRSISAPPPAHAGQVLTIRNAEAFTTGHLHVAQHEATYVAPGICPHPEALLNPATPEEDEVRSLGHTGIGGHTLVYHIGPAPQEPRELLDQAVRAAARHGGALAGAVQSVGAALIAGSQAAEPSAIGLRTRLHLADPGLDDAAARAGTAALAPLMRALYQLESLRWAARTCEGLLLTLALHGGGWERHPDLAPFAKPAPRHRRDLVRIVQHGALALHADTGFMLRQSVLEIVSAGGLILVREHPFNAAVQAFARFVVDRAPAAEDMDQARTAVDEDGRIELDALAGWLEAVLPQDQAVHDPVRLVRQAMQGGLLDRNLQPLPGYELVRFSSAETLEERIIHWSRRGADREKLVDLQRRALLARLGWEAHLRRAVRGVAGMLVA